MRNAYIRCRRFSVNTLYRYGNFRSVAGGVLCAELCIVNIFRYRYAEHIPLILRFFNLYCRAVGCQRQFAVKIVAEINLSAYAFGGVLIFNHKSGLRRRFIVIKLKLSRPNRFGIYFGGVSVSVKYCRLNIKHISSVRKAGNGRLCVNLRGDNVTVRRRIAYLHPVSER